MNKNEATDRLNKLEIKKEQLENKLSLPEVYSDLTSFAVTATELEDTNKEIEELRKWINENA